MKKILVLTDFSQAATHAFAYARSFFADSVADFHLLCACPVEADPFYSQKEVADSACATYTAQLSALIADLRQQATDDWHTFHSTVRSGALLDVVNEVLEAEPYDFVVVGAKKDGTNELFGNSVTSLIRQLHSNLLIVPVDAPLIPIWRVVLATDFASLKNCKLLSPLKDIVTLKGASLTLLTVDTPDKQAIAVEQEARIRHFLFPIQPAVARVKAPTPTQGIIDYIASHPSELLVTLSTHKSWRSILNEESVTRKLAYAPPVPMLALYDDGKSDRPQIVEDLSDMDMAL